MGIVKKCVSGSLQQVRFVVAILAIALSYSALGAIPRSDIVIKLETIASGIDSPLTVTHANDGSGRLFIVDQTGFILIAEHGAVLPTPFLDISNEIPELNPNFDVRGLLGLAFHPDYASNGRFFVRHSKARPGDPGEPCFGSERGCNSEVVAEYSVSTDAYVANPNGTIIFSVDAPEYDHNAGEIAFGPDGYLYFSLGDGGGKHDGLDQIPPAHGPLGNGQNIETTLGSVLRIDVDSPPAPGLNYAIPADNPFVNAPGADEIYAYGFRNPYRFSFDNGLGGSGALILGDVGQELFEEINIVYKGGNYGWAAREGDVCFDPFDPENPPANCPATGPHGEPLIGPIASYQTGVDGVSAIGGYSYRGVRANSLRGTYVFGDFTESFAGPSGRLFKLNEPGPDQFDIQELRIGVEDQPYGLYLKGFGEDEKGEVYVCGTSAFSPFAATGVVQRIRETVHIGTCDTHTDNITITEDIGLADFTNLCAAVASENANYINCIVSVANALEQLAFVETEEKANLIRCASAQRNNLLQFDATGTESGITIPGTSDFQLLGANWMGGSVAIAAAAELTASGQTMYDASAGTAAVSFDHLADSATFFFVHGSGVPAGEATAYDGNDNAVATVSSQPATSPADPANFISLNSIEPIARIEFSGGAIDSFLFATQTAPPLVPADLNDDQMLDATDLGILAYSVAACPSEGICPSDLNGDNTVDVSDLLQMFLSVPCSPGACPFDFNGDGIATVPDLLLFLNFLQPNA